MTLKALPSINKPVSSVAVPLLLALIDTQQNHDNNENSQGSTVPAQQQGQIRRVDRRAAETATATCG